MKTVNIDVVTVADNSFPSSLTFQSNKLERLTLHPSQLFASEARANSSGALLLPANGRPVANLIKNFWGLITPFLIKTILAQQQK